jgi:outer membrane protein insertion porin family
VYVRNITFSGTNKINDEVLRRELRQLEGAWLSNTSLERSKQRIQRLPYVKNVTSETTPVPDTPDRVDVNFKVEDGPSSQLGGGIGYSQSQGIMLNGSFVDSNTLGTGERLAVELNGGRYSKVYSVSHTDPYFTEDGVSRTLNLSYADVSRLTSTYSTFSTKTYVAGLDFGYPISEWQAIHFGSSVQHAELATATYSSTQLQDWVRHNGSSYFRAVGTDYVLGTRIDSLDVSTGWSYDSRNRTIFPTTGAAHRFQVTATVPGAADVAYMTTTYQYQQYFHIPYLPLLSAVPLSLDTHLSYGTAIGNTTALPPNRNFFSGGPETVRGFREGTLGPRDSLGNPYGGDSALTGQLEAILPMPRKFSDSARVSLFFDFGQSFYLGNTAFYDKAGFRVHYGFDLQQLRTSTGISVQWLAPLGLFRFSLAMPINYQHDDWKHYGDDVEMFQFSIGNSF